MPATLAKQLIARWPDVAAVQWAATSCQDVPRADPYAA
jgi:hypothetical protein